MQPIVLIRGGGDLASGVVLRLHRAGIKIIVTEIAQPVAVRRLVSFAEAIYTGQFEIEDVAAQRCEKADDAASCLESGIVPVLVDPGAGIRRSLPVSVVVDGRMTKHAPGTGLDFAPLVVGLGPGFEAGVDCHAIVETMRGPFLGRVYWQGKAEADTGLPETVGAYQAERVLRAPADGIFRGKAQIGDRVKKGDVLAEVNGQPLLAHFDGVLRGLLHDGLRVRQKVKVGDLDPRNDPKLCRMVSDKALSVGGGVMEAILTLPRFAADSGSSMKLVDAVRLSEGSIVAIVGAGGKTSVLTRLGRELPGPVFITTTTHLGVNQAEMADRQVIIPENGELTPYLRPPDVQVTLFTGPATVDDRLSRIGNSALESLRVYCLENRIPLLIEADGSRRLPLKAPAQHEPAVPSWVSDVIVVAGMQGIGKLLTDEAVHRSERFAAIAGLNIGETITSDAVSKLLLHPEGGLKNIPPHARRIALLNQSDTDAQKSQAGKIAGELTSSYNVALVGALQNPGDDEISACYKPVAGIILAAGAAERYGAPKPLLEWQGEAFVRRIARTALQAGLMPVVVVTGSGSEAVETAVADLPVQVVFNPDWKSGQASSVKTGLKALVARTGAAIFFVADQPQVTPTILAAELETHRKTQAAIVAPMIDGKRANPVLFDQAAFESLSSISGDAGGRQVFSKFPVSWLEWNDTNLLLDVDTPQDYQRLLDTQ